MARTGAEGRLVDVCESTATRGLTDNDYLRGAAILGRDDRAAGWPCSSGRNWRGCNPIGNVARCDRRRPDGRCQSGDRSRNLQSSSYAAPPFACRGVSRLLTTLQ